MRVHEFHKINLSSWFRSAKARNTIQGQFWLGRFSQE